MDFEQHLSANRKWLFYVTLKMTKNYDEAEDLVQEVMLQALEYRSEYEEHGNIRAWLARIMKNRFINKCRRNSLHKKICSRNDISELIHEWSGSSSIARMNGEQSVSNIQTLEALQKLPKDFCMVVGLVDLIGLKYEEAASAIGCPRGTIMSRLHRGRKMLANNLAIQEVA
jgi:RNA polymerase sigma-70 factor (ECF subfamily)